MSSLPSIERTPLPKAPQGWFACSYSVDWNGKLSILYTDDDVLARWERRDSPRPGTMARIFTVDGGQGPEFVLPSIAPRFDRLPNDSWIVDGQIVETNGTSIAEIDLGNCSDIQTDIEGRIWVGYHDEGVFGHGDVAPIGAPGIVRFTSDGRIDWSFEPPSKNDPWIADCYALNVGAEETWTCFYTDFPIVRIGADASIRYWRNDAVFGAAAIAADGDRVALFGGYREHANRLALMELRGSDAVPIVQLTLAAGARRRVFGRGDTIHIVGDDAWQRIRVRDIPA